MLAGMYRSFTLLYSVFSYLSVDFWERIGGELFYIKSSPISNERTEWVSAPDEI